jgi:uncharacterized protein (TIGR03086 family)
MDLLDVLSQTFDHASTLADGVRPTQLDARTPCEEWDVRALLSHMMGVVVNMGRGASGDELLSDMNAFQLDDDLGARFRSEADRTLAAWTTRGLEGEVDVGAGPMPAALAVSINLVDTATHAWDLARATGQDGTLPDALAVTVLEVGKGFVTDDTRTFAGIDPAVPVAADASPTHRLVAFMGRRP